MATTGDAEGRVDVTEPGAKDGKARGVALAPGRVGALRNRGPALVTGTAAMAPGLLATRVGADPLAAVACQSPQPETWFTGLGAQGTHASTLELVNPDGGPAVVDLELFAASGPVSAPNVRGVAVPGRGVVRLDLSKEAPLREVVSARVVVTRGRAAVSALDVTDPIGAGPVTREWLPGQTEPSESTVLPGLVRGGGHTLVLANPGDDEARVRVQLVGRGTFTPTAAKEIRVPGGTTVTRALGWLDAELRRGQDTVALELDSTQPIVSSLHTRSEVTSQSPAPPAPLVHRGAVALPAGRAQLVLAGATTAGQATVSVHGTRGRQLMSKDLRVSAGTGTRIPLPRGAAYVQVDVRNTTLVAAVELAADRAELRCCRSWSPRRRGWSPPCGRPCPDQGWQVNPRAAPSSGPRHRAAARAARRPAGPRRCARSPRARSQFSARCSIGRRKTTSRVGVAPCPRISAERGTRWSTDQSSGTSGVSSTAYSTRPSRWAQRDSRSATHASTSRSKRSREVGRAGVPATRGSTAGPRIAASVTVAPPAGAGCCCGLSADDS